MIKDLKKEFDFIINELSLDKKHYYFGYISYDCFILHPVNKTYTSFQINLLKVFFNYLFENDIYLIQSLRHIPKDEIKELLVKAYFEIK